MLGPRRISDPIVTVVEDDQSWAGYGSVADDARIFNLSFAPQTSTRVTVVGLSAERQLLGEAGAFLDPLIDIEPDAETAATDIAFWAERSDSDFASNVLRQEERGSGCA